MRYSMAREYSQLMCSALLTCLQIIRLTCLVRFFFQGDAERSKTLICRFGPNSKRHPLFLMWYKDNVPISEPFAVHLDHGEVAIPSFKAVGSDFKTRKIPTLRHATGFVGTDGPVPKISRAAQKRVRGE